MWGTSQGMYICTVNIRQREVRAVRNTMDDTTRKRRIEAAYKI